MTDKQIIIDGVNVNGCEFCDLKGSNIPQCRVRFASFEPICKGYNCYYKQLARKEQELKNICKAFDIEYIIDKETGNLIGRCNKLYKKEQECEELKKANKHIEHNRNQKADKLMRIEKLITACSTGYTDEFIQELLVILHEPEPNSFENKYKATLAEIKEIAEKQVKRATDGETFARPEIKQILQKINECEVNNDR